ncbi:hypothetical protein CEV08_05555 [Bartonella tribocorum]|uniref:Uncharacterized protein n=1 Tax=Bartonella tribocorum TaxID=85701 RepID=A0A2M6UU89_9HYPH|nr:hypothetical protein CEV08_05555 [Bartonella tribocorum]
MATKAVRILLSFKTLTFKANREKAVQNVQLFLHLLEKIFCITWQLIHSLAIPNTSLSKFKHESRTLEMNDNMLISPKNQKISKRTTYLFKKNL